MTTIKPILLRRVFSDAIRTFTCNVQSRPEMEKKFEISLEGYQSNLALFHPNPVDTGIEQIQYIDYRPINQLSSGSFVELNISPTSMEYID